MNGLIFILLFLDNYFLNCEEIFKDENGNYDYEFINVLDLKLLNYDLEKFMIGVEVEFLIYNFKIGEKEWKDYRVKVFYNGVFIFEGIYGLNFNLIFKKLNNNIFKIYILVLI